MLYILAIILPPIALFVAGKPIQGILNAVLFLLSIIIFAVSIGTLSFLSFPLWVVAVVHALFVVHGYRTDQKITKIAREVAGQSSGGGE